MPPSYWPRLVGSHPHVDLWVCPCCGESGELLAGVRELAQGPWEQTFPPAKCVLIPPDRLWPKKIQ